MIKKTYFSLFQEDDFLYSGRNSATKKQAIDAGVDYVLSDNSNTEKENKQILALSDERKESWLNGAANITVEQHEEEMETI